MSGRRPRRRRVASRGQAAIEVLACIPLLVLVGLLAWQLAALILAGMQAEERVRADALRARAGGARGLVTGRAVVPVPALLPGLRGLKVTAEAAVRVP